MDLYSCDLEDILDHLDCMGYEVTLKKIGIKSIEQSEFEHINQVANAFLEKLRVTSFVESQITTKWVMGLKQVEQIVGCRIPRKNLNCFVDTINFKKNETFPITAEITSSMYSVMPQIAFKIKREKRND